MKKLIFLLLLLIPVMGFSQNPFKGFFKPIAATTLEGRYSVGALTTSTGQFLFRPAIAITAVQLNWNKVTKQFDASALNQAGLGIGYQHFKTDNGVIFNDFGFNAIVLLGADMNNPQPANVSFALTGSFLQYVNLGCLYNFTGKNFGILTGVTLKF
jgi:hypothetical protein